MILLDDYSIIVPEDFVFHDDRDYGRDLEIGNEYTKIKANIGICMGNPLTKHNYSSRTSKDSAYVWIIDTGFYEGTHKAALSFYQTKNKCKGMNFGDTADVYGGFLSGDFNNQEELKFLVNTFNSFEFIEK